MSKETLEWLNTMTLIGFTEKRGNAWHFSDAHQGELSNHYPGAIPVGDVQRRLFNWEPVKVPVEYTVNGVTYTSDERVVIVKSDDFRDVGVFKKDYEPHPYRQWLLDVVSNLVGDTLAVGSAGLLRKGGQAWVSVEVPENVTTPEGVVFRPHLLAVTSLDGSLATTYKRVITNVVCDNTMSVALGERDGGIYKVKHTRNSAVRLTEARKALDMVTATSEDFEREVRELCSITVTDQQWSNFLDVHFPLPEEKGRSRTIFERKREELTETYRTNPMVRDWTGTAWGVVQAVNTHAHHITTVQGKSRAEANWQKAVKGDFDALDGGTIAELNKVLAAA